MLCCLLQNALLLYRGVGEKWQVMGWNMVRMATDCGAKLNPLEYVYVARRLLPCFWALCFPVAGRLVCSGSLRAIMPALLGSGVTNSSPNRRVKSKLVYCPRSALDVAVDANKAASAVCP
jgi:hypothetical protein